MLTTYSMNDILDKAFITRSNIINIFSKNKSGCYIPYNDITKMNDIKNSYDTFTAYTEKQILDYFNSGIWVLIDYEIGKLLYE